MYTCRLGRQMLKWLLTLFIALAVLTAAMPWLAQRFRVGRLPGDVVVRVRGRDYYLPFTSTVILSLLVAVLTRLI